MISETHFKHQMNRLADTFGANQYKTERVQVIWKAVKDLSDAWLTKTVDYFVGYFRQAPLMQEFEEEISKERERLYRLERETEEREAKQFMSHYSGQDIQTICSQIRDRVVGKMPESDFNSMLKLLKRSGS